MRRKVTVIGAGNVGATCAQEIARRDYADVVLVDIIPNFPQGKALDMNQAAAVLSYEPNITGTNGYEDTAGSDVIVVTAGKPRAPGMSRDDLVTTNEAIVGAVTKDAVKRSPKAIVVVVSNPLDAMCHVAKAVSKLPRERVFGMAGILDTARFRAFIAWETGASIKDVQTMVLGGHGDQMVPGRLRDDRRRRSADGARLEGADREDGAADARRRRRDRQPPRHVGVVRARRGRGADGRRDHASTRSASCPAPRCSRASTASTASTWACP